MLFSLDFNLINCSKYKPILLAVKPNDGFIVVITGTITKMDKGIASWEFPKEQSLVEDKPESGTQKYSKCQTPPYEKNKLLLNEYLGDFMLFETIFFVENDFFNGKK